MKELREMEENGHPIVNGLPLLSSLRRGTGACSCPLDAYPMPRTDELLDKLGSAQYITTLDLARGYWQVPLAERDRTKTAFITSNMASISSESCHSDLMELRRLSRE